MVNKGDASHVTFSKVFNVLSHNIHASKLVIYSPDGWATRWVSSSLGDWAQNVMVTGSQDWVPVLGAGNEWSPAGLSCDLSCLTSLRVTWRKQWRALLSRLLVSRFDARATIQRDLDRLAWGLTGTLCNPARTAEFMRLSRSPRANTHWLLFQI